MDGWQDDKASLGLLEAVKQGLVKATDAKKIVDRPHSVQDDAVDRVRDGKAKTLAAAVKQIDKASADRQNVPLDAYGNVIPARCRDAYADRFLQESYDTLCLMSEKIRMSRMIDGAEKRKRHYPFMVVKDFQDGIGYIIDYLDSLIGHIKDCRPAGVCQSCEGKGCGACRMSGMLPRRLYDEEAARRVA